MELFLIIFEYLITIAISLIIALMLVSILTWRPGNHVDKKEPHWLLEIEEVDTKHGKTFLIYNKLNDEFLYQVKQMDELMPWLVEQLEKNKERTIAILDPSGNARPIDLVKTQKVT